MLLFGISRRFALMLIASYPQDQDITMCFDDQKKLTSILIEPSNVSYWVQNADEKDNFNCLTLGGHVELMSTDET